VGWQPTLDPESRRCCRAGLASYHVSLAIMRFLALLLSWAALAAARYGVINGEVRDARNGEPLAYCNVYLEGTEFGAAANVRGYFFISGVPDGEFELVASFVGYEDERRRVMVQEGRPLHVELDLQPASIRVREVQVTAERARFEREVQVSTTRLDTRQLQLVPRVGGEADLFRTIQLLPCVVTTSDFSNRLYIRGGSPDQNLILLDGITVYNPSHLFGLFSPFVSDAVSDVTLLAGGFPAEYGGRMSSVLDVTTREGNTREYTGSGSASIIAAQGLVEGPIPKGSFLVAGRRTYLADPLLRAFGVDGLGYYFYDLMGKVNYEPVDESRITLAGILAEDVLSFSDPNGSGDLSGRLRWGNRGFSCHWHRMFSPLLYVEMIGSYSNFRTGLAAQVGSPDTVSFEAGVTDCAVKADANWYAADRFTVDFGTELRYMLPSFGAEFSSISFSRSDTLWPLTAYADGKWEAIEKKLFVKPGLRLAWDFALRRFEPEPRLGLKYQPLKNTALNLAAGRFTQHILTSNSTEAVFSIFDAWAPVQDFQATPAAWHGIAGVEQWLGSDMVLSAETYYKLYENLLETRYGERYTRPDSLLPADGYSTGLDLMLRRTEGRVSGWVTYSYMWTRRQIRGESDAYAPHYDRRHSVNLVLSIPKVWWQVDVTAKWSLGSGLPYSGYLGYFPRYIERPFNWSEREWEYLRSRRDGYRYPLYHRLDIGLARTWTQRWGEITAFVDVINAYNARNPLLYFWEVNEQGLPERGQIGNLPILPTLGAKVRF